MSTILVVDDDDAIREGLQLLLELSGYSVVTARDGVEALETLNQQIPALVLLDLTMPRLDGFGLARELERRHLRPGLPIIVLTADGSAQDSAEGVGAERCMRKPFDSQVLLDQVERLTSQRGA